MKKNKFAIIKDFEKYNDNFNIKKTYYQIINYDYYFRLEKFIKIKV